MSLWFSADALPVSGLRYRVFEIPTPGVPDFPSTPVIAIRNVGSVAITGGRLYGRMKATDAWTVEDLAFPTVPVAPGETIQGQAGTPFEWAGWEVDVANGGQTRLDVRVRGVVP